MKNKQIKITINIGTNDAERLKLGHEKLYMEGDVVSIDEVIADKLIAEKMAVEYDDAVKKADAEAAKKAHEDAIKAALPEAERELAIEAAKAEATKRAKAKPDLSHGPMHK